MRTADLSIVVPAFDEAERLPATLDRLVAELDDVVGPTWEIVVSDDGSTDGTAAVVRRCAVAEPRIRLVGSARNQGKGAALRSGARAAVHDLVAFLDADLPVPVQTLGDLVEGIADLDLLVGSRRLVGSSFASPQPLVRRVGGRGFLAATRLLGFAALSDPQCGVKLLRREVLLPVLDDVTCQGYAFDIEVVTRARRAGLRVGEMAVQWAHVPGSSVRPVRDAVRTLRDLAALRRHLPPAVAEGRPSQVVASGTPTPTPDRR